MKNGLEKRARKISSRGEKNSLTSSRTNEPAPRIRSRGGNDSGLIGRMGWGRVFASVNFRQIWGYVFVQLRKFIRTIGRLIDR